MNLKSKFVTGLLTLSLSIGIFTPSSFASTMDTAKGDSNALQVQKGYQIKDIKENYSEQKVQERLIEKVNKGEMLDNINPEKAALAKKEKINDTTTVTTYPDGSKEVSGIDYSEAKFFDEKGNEVQPKKEDLKGITGPQGSISGGTWSSGSGYSCVQGATVYRNKYSHFDVSYKVDYCNHNGAYDKLDRVYGIDIDAPGGDFDIQGEGVFRTWESSGYSAYGGVNFKYLETGAGSSTQYLYIRVGNDSAWEDSNITH
ncbi:hypothetical protein [Bacillus cereus group sp. N21]|uniref:hypothetical protein n=1 Tax=Bacillus cereus group sp. N21 TaxID=2794591 RepID=UPI0018F5B44E|nr:hypothetical protein [Bacillus cereus group sp. N21]MBJ8031064.1 hypothetical protein [Bacillus cereus group sp. N21]